ncbi:hypothetical protein [Paenibacillus sp. Z6-24]
MINEKKIKLAYKKYVKNFSKGVTPEKTRKEYIEDKNESNEIIEQNNTEQDHILLINLSSVFNHNTALWKEKILIQESKQTDAFKTMQMTVFYECMIQELYLVRYPTMQPIYTFNRLIAALVHFTIFGWEKEEQILFEFINKHFGQHLINVNEDSEHIWFLLELYLRYRNKTIFGSNHQVYRAVKEKLEIEKGKGKLIPNKLDIYDEVLRCWQTTSQEDIAKMIDNMVERHSLLVGEIGEMGEFGDFLYGFYPYEILFLLHVRKKLNLSVPNSFEDFLMNTAEAKMQFEDPEPYPEWDPMLRMIDDFYRKNYSEYIPNQHGPLFE